MIHLKTNNCPYLMHTNLLMMQYMLGNGNRDNDMEEESNSGQMDQFIRDTGKMAQLMDKEG